MLPYSCYIFMMPCAAAKLHARIELEKRLHMGDQEGVVTSRCKAIRNLLENYAKGAFIVTTDTETMPFTQK